MNVSKIIKLTIASVIAILLTGSILYFKMQRSGRKEMPVSAVPIEESVSSPIDEQQILESLSAPAVSEQSTDVKEEDDARILESLSTPAQTDAMPVEKESDAEILNSLSAPEK